MNGERNPGATPNMHSHAPDRSPRRLLAIALPFVVSLVCSGIDLSILLRSWLPFLLGCASAMLLRTRWALLVVPLTLALGTIPSIVIGDAGLPDFTDSGFIAGAILFLVLALIPATLGAALGLALSHELDRSGLASQ